MNKFTIQYVNVCKKMHIYEKLRRHYLFYIQPKYGFLKISHSSMNQLGTTTAGARGKVQFFYHSSL